MVPRSASFAIKPTLGVYCTQSGVPKVCLIEWDVECQVLASDLQKSYRERIIEKSKLEHFIHLYLNS